MRLRLHWLLLTTVILTIVSWLGAMWALERANRRAYDRDTQALADAGFVMDWDTVAVGITPADPAALAIWTAWCAHVPGVQEDPSLTTWIRSGRGAPPPVAQVLVDTHRAAMATVLPLLRDGRLCWGVRANLHDWLSGPRDPNALLNPASLFGARAVAHWLRWQALTAPDPRLWLDDLDRLVAAGDPPLCAIDGLIGIAVAAIRDETRFAHIRRLHGQLDPDHPWLTQRDDLHARSTTMRMGERLFGSEQWDQILFGGISAGTTGPSTWQESLKASVYALDPRMHWQWATLPAGMSFVRWTQATHEADLRGVPGPPPPSGTGGAGNWVAAMSLTSLVECHIAFGEHHLRSCILRLAARLLLDQRAGVAIPADTAALHARYGDLVLAAAPGSVPVLYSREADGGFTLAGDISAPTSLKCTLRNDQRLTVPATDLAP